MRLLSWYKEKGFDYLDVAGVIFILAIFSLVWREGNVVLVPVPKIFETLTFCVGLLLLWSVVYIRQARLSFDEFLKRTVEFRLPLLILLATPLFGILGSAFQGLSWRVYERDILFEYIRIVFVIYFFLLTAYLVFLRPRIVTHSLYATTASSLIFWAALIHRWQPLFLDGGRLRGAANDPNFLATWIAGGFIISCVFFLWNDKKVNWWAFINALLLFPLLLWTGSRGAWFVTAIAFLVTVGYFLVRTHVSYKALSVSALIVGLLFSLVAGFLVLPTESKNMIVARGLGSVLSNAGRNRILIFFGETRDVSSPFFDEITWNPELLAYGQNRGDIFRTGLPLLLHNPIGFGPAYYNWQPLFVLPNGNRLGAHDLWLEVGLTAGWIGLAAWLYLLFIIGKRLLRLALLGGRDIIALVLLFLTFLSFGFFLDTFTLRWFWLTIGLILGLSLSYEHKEKTRNIS